MYIIIDTETTSKYEDKGRIVQLSYLLCDQQFNIVNPVKNFIIKPRDFIIDPLLSAVDIHGITNEIALQDGVDIEIAFTYFYDDIKMCSVIIAHNSEFDIKFIMMELRRVSRTDIIEEIEKKTILCSMKFTKALVNAKNIKGYKKYPTLSELYVYATGEIIQNAHDAKYDVINLHRALQVLYSDNKIRVDIDKKSSLQSVKTANPLTN